MKKLKILLFSFLLQVLQLIPGSANAQETVSNYLFLFGQVNVPSQTDITHTLTAVGTYWEWGSSYYPLSTDSELEEASVLITGSTTSEPSDQDPGAWKGFVFPWTPSPYLKTDSIAYGIYKVTNSYNNDYFYIDLRDCKYAGSVYGPCGHYSPDFYIRYNDLENSFKWKRSGEWTLISTGEVLNVWDICNNGTLPSTASFEDFWENALVAVPDGNNHPLLVWGPYPNPGILTGPIVYYKIYYNQHTHGNPPGTLTLLGTVQDDVYMYEDIGATVGNGELDRSYYVKAVFNDGEESLQETEPTNTVTIQLSQNQQKILLSKDIKIDKDILLQNYPNPFNPTTNIKYQISDYGFVTLKVYDVLGKEVATLINEQKQAGNYSVEFDGSNLPSGIYFYTLTSGEFLSTKKLILMKRFQLDYKAV